MKLITITSLLLLFASPLLAAAATGASDDQQPFSLVELSRLIAEGDDQPRLAAYLHNRVLHFSPFVDDQLEAAIRLGRPASFRCLFFHVRFLAHHRSSYREHMTNYLRLALSHHRTEICDFLLGLDCEIFQVDRTVTAFWNQLPFLWAVDELVNLVRRHLRFTEYMAPRWNSMVTAPSLEAATRMIEFVEQLHAVGHDFPKGGYNHPTALLEGLMENELLSDAEMASLLARLLQLGAEPDKDSIDYFAEMHPDNVMSHRILLEESEIKEPAEE
jgi:hypothetical protein